MLLRTGSISQHLTWLQICILSPFFEKVVWIISSHCVLELNTVRLITQFSFQASTQRNLTLMTTMPCSSVSDTASWISWLGFHLPVVVVQCVWVEGLRYSILFRRYSGFSIVQIAVCQYNLNSAQISDLVQRSEHPLSLIVLHNRGHDRWKSGTTVRASEYDILPH